MRVLVDGGRILVSGGLAIRADNPLASPGLIAFCPASQANDSGGILTVSNLISGGPPLVASGIGRPTIGMLYRDHPGIIMTGSTVPLSMALGSALNGLSAFTIFATLMDSGTSTTAGLFQLGDISTFPAAIAAYFNRQGGFPQIGVNRSTVTEGAVGEVTAGGKEPLEYPRVIAVATDLLSRLAVYSDGRPLATSLVGVAPPYDGSASSGISFAVGSAIAAYGYPAFTGIVGSVALFSRRFSGDEIASFSDLMRRYDGQNFARSIALIGDSRFACSTVGSAQWVRAMIANAEALTDKPLTIRLTGPFRGQEQTTFPHDRTWSVAGQQVANEISGIFIPQQAEQYLTDVAIWNLGVNDVLNGGLSATQTRDSLAAAILDAHSRWPSAKHLIEPSIISPNYPDAGKVATLAAYNALLPTLVTTLQGQGVVATYDPYLLNTPPTFLGDNLHWAASSEATLAARYLSLLQNLAA